MENASGQRQLLTFSILHSQFNTSALPSEGSASRRNETFRGNRTMADGKWISELTAETPLADAARRVLMMRLEVVHRFLPLAVREAAKDPEYVHQLRVGTRRAGAALVIFKDCLPAKIYKKARKELKKVRRAAGQARDWDVFVLALAERQRQLPA